MFIGDLPELGGAEHHGAGDAGQSAILSAVIFNALIIIALIPIALKGVRYRPSAAAALLRRNLLIYGLGGVIVPFIGIKLIDLVDRPVPGDRRDLTNAIHYRISQAECGRDCWSCGR